MMTLAMMFIGAALTAVGIYRVVFLDDYRFLVAVGLGGAILALLEI